MKHGVLIIWHENFKQLKELILSFNDSFHIYVHVDRKALLTQKELSWLDSCPIVKGVYRKYKVTWGTFSLLKAELFLMEKAIADPEITYLHMISGQDYPIKSMAEILQFFERHEGKEFILSERLPMRNGNMVLMKGSNISDWVLAIFPHGGINYLILLFICRKK